MRQHIFVTGPPGVGRGTLIQRMLEQPQLHAVPHGIGGTSSSSAKASLGSADRLIGCYTEEVRAGDERVGFDLVTVAGQRGPKVARAGNTRVRQHVEGVATCAKLASLHFLSLS